MQERSTSNGVTIVKEPKFLRHFTAWFEHLL